ncbi:MAG: hypothetical protein ACYCYI_04620 [Saccharofermentanales bacterium]
MTIHIELSSSLSKHMKSGSMEFPGGSVSDALAAFGLSLDDVGFVIHQGTKCELDSPATDGETYKVCPPIIAG